MVSNLRRPRSRVWLIQVRKLTIDSNPLTDHGRAPSAIPGLHRTDNSLADGKRALLKPQLARSHRFWRDSVAAVSSLSRQDEPEVRRVVKIGATRHLFCLLQLMALRPLWLSQDQVINRRCRNLCAYRCMNQAHAHAKPSCISLDSAGDARRNISRVSTLGPPEPSTAWCDQSRHRRRDPTRDGWTPRSDAPHPAR